MKFYSLFSHAPIINTLTLYSFFLVFFLSISLFIFPLIISFLPSCSLPLSSCNSFSSIMSFYFTPTLLSRLLPHSFSLARFLSHLLLHLLLLLLPLLLLLLLSLPLILSYFSYTSSYTFSYSSSILTPHIPLLLPIIPMTLCFTPIPLLLLLLRLISLLLLLLSLLLHFSHPSASILCCSPKSTTA